MALLQSDNFSGRIRLSSFRRKLSSMGRNSRKGSLLLLLLSLPTNPWGGDSSCLAQLAGSCLRRAHHSPSADRCRNLLRAVLSTDGAVTSSVGLRLRMLAVGSLGVRLFSCFRLHRAPMEHYDYPAHGAY